MFLKSAGIMNKESWGNLIAYLYMISVLVAAAIWIFGFFT
ncbi:hypothetical protein EV11_0916 [Prochlorococcus sp. SS52]|nr:hypothetical protein EV04_0242 [Prochlorococcus marinus str. LG]KGG22037.1 hypothetical protein EV08_0211 [Prochlorococcus marinus str. SS2]KGG24645.1 hypothetical protein EV09_0277 [Prochlorococcus marinus str. SS35]KGG33538.1 hypothetical protein EV10_0747 [Prochlorococcus marinus str. SS51]KGG36225.1 hypothetical protein EV11_0916 [Prochlorococcus sp. SS52]